MNLVNDAAAGKAAEGLIDDLSVILVAIKPTLNDCGVKFDYPYKPVDFKNCVEDIKDFIPVL